MDIKDESTFYENTPCGLGSFGPCSFGPDRLRSSGCMTEVELQFLCI